MKICLINLLYLLLFCTARTLHAQQNDTTENAQQAGIFLEHRTDALDQYLDKTNILQQRLLKHLQRKEDKMLRKLAKQDSSLYKQ